jgi:hypothetical protein
VGGQQPRSRTGTTASRIIHVPELGFAMTVRDVFVLTDRVVVIASGEACQGELPSGTTVQVWQGDQLLANSPAYIELHARPGTVAVVLTAPGVRVEPGCRIVVVTP